MIPFEVRQRIQNPGKFQEEIIKYFKKAGLNFTQTKTLAGIKRTDIRVLEAKQNADFFTGSFNQLLTNMQNSYLPPETEHMLIYAIRVYESDASITDPTDPNQIINLDWEVGVTNAILKNATYTITNNSLEVLRNEPFVGHYSQSFMTTRDTGYVALTEPIVWGGQNPLKLRLNAIAPFPLPYNVMVELIGVGMI